MLIALLQLLPFATAVNNLMAANTGISWNGAPVTGTELTDGLMGGLWESPNAFNTGDELMINFNPPVNIGSILMVSTNTPKVSMALRIGQSNSSSNQ